MQLSGKNILNLRVPSGSLRDQQVCVVRSHHMSRPLRNCYSGHTPIPTTSTSFTSRENKIMTAHAFYDLEKTTGDMNASFQAIMNINKRLNEMNPFIPKTELSATA